MRVRYSNPSSTPGCLRCRPGMLLIYVVARWSENNRAGKMRFSLQNGPQRERGDKGVSAGVSVDESVFCMFYGCERGCDF